MTYPANKIVVVGCSGVGAIAALSLKKLQKDLEVTVIREPDEQGLLTRCATPYICCGEVMVEPSYKDDAAFTDANIKLVNAVATGLDRRNKIITTADGEKHPYDKRIAGHDTVNEVELTTGETIRTQMVLISAGVRPNSELAEQAGLQMGRFGLTVDCHLRTSDPDIYAGGDLIEYPHWVTSKPAAGRLRPNAVIAGRVIAWNILGETLEYPGLINGFATRFYDQSIAGTGLTQKQAEAEGFTTVCATRTSTSMHSMMRGRKSYTIKLVFDRQNGRIIGGQIISDSPAPVKHIDVITTAMRGRLTALDLATLRCAGQPELSPDPGREPIALAAGEAFNLMRHGPERK